MRQYTATNEMTGEKKEIRIRALSRREIKDLKPLGYNYFGCTPDKERIEAVVDGGLERTLPAGDMAFLEECPARETTAVWRELLKETYGAPDEEKNSGNTSGGSQTESA